MKRKTIAALLVIAIIMGLSAPAYAEDIPDGAEPPQAQEQPQEPEQEQIPVVVSTLDELQAAIDAAEDGDTIAVSSTIKLKNQSVVTDKNLTIVPLDDSIGAIFQMGKNSHLSGFTIMTKTTAINLNEYGSNEISISQCTFLGDENWYCFLLNIIDATVQISECRFENSKDMAIRITGNSSVTIDGCYFGGNSTILQGAAVNNNKNCKISNSVFENNSAGIGGGIYNAGTMEISGCTFSGNKSTDSVGQDVVSVGTLTVLDEGSDAEGYYEETTGEKIALPLNASTDAAKLIYLTSEQAAEYFAPEVEDEPESTPDPEQPEDEDTDTDADEPTDPDTLPDTEPTNPAPTPDDPEDSDGGESDDTSKQQPTQPPADDDGSEETPEQPTQPEEPSDDDSGDGDVNTPVEPPEPPQDEDSSDDENTPPVIYRPPYRPTRPIAPNPEPEDPVEPEPTPALVCGEAAIDTSRSIILLGYGDGDLHEEDSLTRAQLATIICRLLDNDSVERLSVDNGQHFTDVPSKMWCYESVQIIARAGIVYGVGGGSYDPNGTVTWAQVLTVLSRFVKQQDYALRYITYDGWALEAVQTAAALGWIEDSAEFNPNAIISRGALAQLVNGILEQYRD